MELPERARENGIGNPLSRRRLLKQTLVLGLTLPAAGTLLAACGGDDEEAATSTASGAATPGMTPTEAAADATPTEAMDEPTATGEMTEPTATSGMDEGTPTSEGEATTPPSGGTFVEGGDRLMGMEFEEGVPGGTFIESGYMPSVNFGYTTSASQQPALVFEALIEPNPFTLEPVGLLAEAWEISEDGTTWSFFLRQGVTWHDGETFDAEDVVFSYGWLMTDELNGYFSGTLNENIASVEQVDEYTVAFTTNGVRPDFLFDGGLQLIAAEHVLGGMDPADYAASDAATGADPAMVVGTGPFKFESLIPDEEFRVVRYDAYWDGTPYLDGYVNRVVPEGTARMTGLLAGDYDYVWEILLSYQQQVEDAGFVLDRWWFFGANSTIFNLDPERPAPYQDVLVRQALFHAVDREAMLSASYEGVGEILDAILRLPAFANPEGITAAYPYDPEQAIALLDEAGWLVGTDGVREKDGQRLAFTLTTTSEWEPFVVDVQVLQEYWRAVGVEVELDLVEYTSLAERVAAGDYEVAHLDYYGQMTPDLTNRFACENPNNFPRYCNEEVDALLEEARVELNQERRVELYTEFQNLVLADLPILPQYFVDGYSAISPRVHNPPTMEALANNWFAAEKVWIEQ